MQHVETVDGEVEQFLVQLGDGKHKDIMIYAIIEAWNKQLECEAEMEEQGQFMAFKEVKTHCKNGNAWEVLMHWEDDSETWEPLSIIWKDDPVTLAQYVRGEQPVGATRMEMLPL